jgi:pimeloyl-ACP methyl ester carboxylesterase
MRSTVLGIFALVVLCGTNLKAQDISGDWQGTLHRGTESLRSIQRISKADDGSWRALVLLIDQRGFDNPALASAVTLRDSVLKLTFDELSGVYDARLSADGNTFKGTWSQRGMTYALDYQRATKETAWRDPAPHSDRFITVEPGVKLEVLDWGGSGRPVVFLAGLGNTAHVFDKFVPQLTAKYHVYGITRRGFGFSSRPPSGYTADRLGDDVLAVLDSLKLDRPVLAGHSIAGEELSSIGSRHPERVAGLIYLDAGYPYAFYDRAHGNFNMDLAQLRRNLERLQSATSVSDARQLSRELLDADLPVFEKSLRDFEKNLPPPPATPVASPPPPPPSAQMAISNAILQGEQKYIDIRTPVLAIYALPHKPPPNMPSDSAVRAAFIARDSASTGLQAEAFERGVPSARVVRLPNADHFVFNSNEADVLREMRAFIDGLPPSKK